MTAGSPHDWQVSKTFPPRGRLQQHRLRAPVQLTCRRCEIAKTTRLVAVVDGDWTQLLCNGCYGTVLSSGGELPSRQRADAQEVPAPPPGVPKQRAGQLRRNIVELAQLLREQADGANLNHADRAAIAELADTPAMAAALRYAELMAEGEALIAEARQRQHEANAAREAVNQLRARRSAVVHDVPERFDDDFQWASEATLESRVMMQVGGKRFRKVFRKTLEARSLPHPLELSSRRFDLWHSLARRGLLKDDLERIPVEAGRLRKLPDRLFFDALVEDARGVQPNGFLAHPAVAQRVSKELRGVCHMQLRWRDQAEMKLASSPGDDVKLNDLRAAIKSYARAEARRMLVNSTLTGMRQLFMRHSDEIRTEYAECLDRAFADISRKDEILAGAVADACVEHRAACDHDREHRSPECVDAIAGVVKRRQLASQARNVLVEVGVSEARVMWNEPTGDQQVGRGAVSSEADLESKSSDVLAEGQGEGQEGQVLVPAVDTEGAWWIDGTSFNEGRLVWRTLLSPLDIACGWCRVPSAPEWEEMAKLPTKLKFRRSGAPSFPEVREVSLRNSLGEWELTGCEWPPDLLAGTQATLIWDLHWKVIYCELAPNLQHQQELAGAFDEFDHDADQAVGRTRADEEAEGAWWLDGEDPPQGCLSWRAALYRMHLDGNWCPVPEGKALHDWTGRPLRWHLRHEGSADLGAAPPHEAKLRRRGGQWELAGVSWPHDLLPGTYVILTWQLDRDLVIAETRPLFEPELVDDRLYAYEYNAQVVTRQNAPGADQDRAVPDLTDMSWVLRTLRLLGYLDADGEAILAEEALVRNCEEAGMPRRRLGGIEEAVGKLILAGYVTRVEGSVDPDGHPWYPPRPGYVRTSLLRYKPRVQALPRQSSPYGSGEGHGNRREHWVSGFVRRLPPGASPSEQQIEAHRQAVAAAEVMDRELPAGYTFVRPHQRNQ